MGATIKWVSTFDHTLFPLMIDWKEIIRLNAYNDKRFRCKATLVMVSNEVVQSIIGARSGGQTRERQMG